MGSMNGGRKERAAGRWGGHRIHQLRTAVLAGVIAAACILAVTALTANQIYKQQKAKVSAVAQTAVELLSENVGLENDVLLRACITYVQEDVHGGEKVQFLDPSGKILASSTGEATGTVVTTPEVSEAVSTRGVCTYQGIEGASTERVFVTAGPVIAHNGEVLGILRFTTDIRPLDGVIVLVAAGMTLMMILIIGVLMLCQYYDLHAISLSVEEINEKAKRIAAGSYGTQISNVYTDEVGDLAATINDLSAKISQNELMQTEFISSLSHELRTPLTAINGWSETLLADESLTADTRRGMKIISGEAKRLTEMVMDLLDFTRMQDGRMTLHMEQTDLRAEFEDTVYMYGSRLAQEGITLEYLDSDEDFPEILCDPKRLRQVFLNVLDNAAKHGGEGKRIEAAIGCADGMVNVYIRDFGPGIPEDELPLVKKKFYKGSSKARGTGIGLAVCDEIVQLHGGTIELSNAEGGGTLVTICLPEGQ